MHISHLTFRAAEESCFGGWGATAICDKFFLHYIAKKDTEAYFLFFIKLFKQYVFCIVHKSLTLGKYLCQELHTPSISSIYYVAPWPRHSHGHMSRHREY